jgi:23S rRNA (cytosine1962-C5)-methyltransferase
MPAVTLKPGREKSLLRRHPWIFSGAVAEVHGEPQAGGTVDVVSAGGDFLARAAFSPASNIRARVWTFDPGEIVDADFFRRRIAAALTLRSVLGFGSFTLGSSSRGKDAGEGQLDAARLIHAESDGLPGLIVDRYGDLLVIQSLTAGVERWLETITDVLFELTGVKSIYERSDADVRELEGLPVRNVLLRGEAPETVVINEYGSRFVVDIVHGHKTGFYLDQRDNRRRVGRLAQGREMLNCFCYSGGFTIHALAGGAKSVVSVDTSAEALRLGRENVTLNALPDDRSTWLEGDVFKVMRSFRDEGRSFDLVVLDPPKFAPTAAQAEKALRGYKDINLLAFKLLRPGGILATFSCSGGVDAALFQKVVASAALDAGAEVQIVERLSQSPDHPVSLHFPEGAYLKGLICYKSR